MAETLQRIVRFEKGFDKRSADPTKNYGVRGMHIRFLLKGEKGAVQFLLYTDWMPKRTVQEYAMQFPDSALKYQANPADIGYHAYVPQYEGATLITESCPELNGVPCYYDGSSLQAEYVYWAFVNEGEEAMWALLQERYDNLIGPENIMALPQGTQEGDETNDQ